MEYEVDEIIAYNFEPEYSDIELLEMERNNVYQEVEIAQVPTSKEEFCSCYNCIVMPLPDENVCCKESNLTIGSIDDHLCITEMPNIQPVVLNRYVLEVAFIQIMVFRRSNARAPDQLSNTFDCDVQKVLGNSSMNVPLTDANTANKAKLHMLPPSDGAYSPKQKQIAKDIVLKGPISENEAKIIPWIGFLYGNEYFRFNRPAFLRENSLVFAIPYPIIFSRTVTPFQEVIFLVGKAYMRCTFRRFRFRSMLRSNVDDLVTDGFYCPDSDAILCVDCGAFYPYRCPIPDVRAVHARISPHCIRVTSRQIPDSELVSTVDLQAVMNGYGETNIGPRVENQGATSNGETNEGPRVENQGATSNGETNVGPRVENQGEASNDDSESQERDPQPTN